MARRVVVIGGGLAGSLLCNELVKTCQVTLLERGDRDSIRTPRVRVTRKKLAEVPTFCYGGGGTTNLWHNGLIPIRINDIANEEFRDVLSASEPYVDQAAEALYFSGDSFLQEHARLVSDLTTWCEALKVFRHGIDCLVYPKTFRKLTVNPQVQAHYNVGDISFVTESGKVTRVRYRTGKTFHEIDADIVVVSSGAMGTPIILQKILKAFAGRWELAGNGFIDHPMGFVGKVRFKKSCAPLAKVLSTYDRGDYISRNAIRLKSRCGKFTGCAFFRPALSMDNRLQIYKFKSSLGASNGLARVRNAMSIKLFHPDILAEIFAHFSGRHLPSRIYNILFIGEQKRGENRVFTDESEPVVEWTVTPEELGIYRGMLRDLVDMLGEVAEEINVVTDISEDWLWSAAHHSCTTPLGASENALIDKHLRVKCSENVYVCDGSVIQEHSYANTGLAIGQLALRLASEINSAARGGEIETSGGIRNG